MGLCRSLGLGSWGRTSPVESGFANPALPYGERSTGQGRRGAGDPLLGNYNDSILFDLSTPLIYIYFIKKPPFWVFFFHIYNLINFLRIHTNKKWRGLNWIAPVRSGWWLLWRSQHVAPVFHKGRGSIRLPIINSLNEKFTKICESGLNQLNTQANQF